MPDCGKNQIARMWQMDTTSSECAPWHNNVEVGEWMPRGGPDIVPIPLLFRCITGRALLQLLEPGAACVKCFLGALRGLLVTLCLCVGELLLVLGNGVLKLRGKAGGALDL